MNLSFDNPASILIKTMIANRRLETQKQIDKYLDALTKLTTWKSTVLKTHYYQDLFYCFDDEGYVPAIHMLIYYMERYDPELQVNTLLEVTDLHIERAPSYLAQFYLSLLYVNETFEIINRKYQTLPHTKKKVVERMLLKALRNLSDFDDEQGQELYQEVQVKIQKILQKDVP